MGDVPAWKKWGALVVFAVQNAGAVLLMRYSKLRHGPAYSNLAAVMMQELIKLGVSTLLYAHECRGVAAMLTALRVDLRDNAVEWLQLAVPAALYTVQNVMLFVGAAHLEAAVAQVTYQAKILFTALFSVLLLGKRLSPNQWLGLAMLVVGVLCVQGVMDQLVPSLFATPTPAPAIATPPAAATATAIATTATTTATATASAAAAAAAAAATRQEELERLAVISANSTRRGGKAVAAYHPKGKGVGLAARGQATRAAGRSLHAAHKARHPQGVGGQGTGHAHPRPASPSAAAAGGGAAQSPMLGIGAMLLAAVCSSFASVYFEKMLKGGKRPSLWLRNMQLASYSAVIAVASLVCTADPVAREQGLLHGFDHVTWAVVLTQSIGGIIVAVCIKYADNILRTFSQTVAVIFGAFGSYFLFDFRITTAFNVGMLFVGVAILLYGHSAQTPGESYRACVGCICPPAGL